MNQNNKDLDEEGEVDNQMEQDMNNNNTNTMMEDGEAPNINQ